MKSSGVSKCVEKAWATIKLYSSAGHQTIKNSSEYYKAAIDLCVPYVKLAGDVYLAAKNMSMKMYNNVLVYAEKKTPVVLDTVSTDVKLRVLSKYSVCIEQLVMIFLSFFLP